jgi:hypothetical protein
VDNSRLSIIGIALLVTIVLAVIVFVMLFIGNKNSEKSDESVTMKDIATDIESLVSEQKAVNPSTIDTTVGKPLLSPPDVAEQSAKEVALRREEAIARMGGKKAANDTNSTSDSGSQKAITEKSKKEIADRTEMEIWDTKVSDEKSRWAGFIGDLTTWANPTRNANEARIKANDIRKDSEEKRKSADGIKSTDKNALEYKDMLMEHASAMVNIADELSSTRGNNMKMREFRSGLAGYK